MTMKKNPNLRRWPGDKPEPSRIEQLTASIQDHLNALERDTRELTEHANTAAQRGCTPEEIDAIDVACMTTPLQMLLLTTRTLIDTLPAGSGIDHERVIEILDRHERAGEQPHDLASDLLDVVRECFNYIRKEVAGSPEERGGEPSTVH